MRLKEWGACIFWGIVIICGLAWVASISPPSKDDLCRTVGMRYQEHHEAPGFRLCYGVNEVGNLKYQEVPKVKQ
jgi:hypothetical protein